MQTPFCGVAGALGKVALKTEGAKPLFCFSSSDLALPAEPSGTCGIRIARTAYSVLVGKPRQGEVVV